MEGSLRIFRIVRQWEDRQLGAWNGSPHSYDAQAGPDEAITSAAALNENGSCTLNHSRLSLRLRVTQPTQRRAHAEQVFGGGELVMQIRVRIRRGHTKRILDELSDEQRADIGLPLTAKVRPQLPLTGRGW
jgi:hypothetical protein